MSDELRDSLIKRIREVERKWEKTFDQEMQQKINTIKTRILELREIFKEDLRKMEDGDSE